MKVEKIIERAESKLADLHPALSIKAMQLIRKAHAEGVFIIITHGTRSINEQNVLYAQGRTIPGKIVTNAKGGYSYHNYGLAFDICVCDMVGGKLIPNWFVDNRWKMAGEIGKALGLEWGGNWKDFKDYPHFQMTFGLTLAELRKGVKPPMTDKVADKRQYRLATGTFNSLKEAEQAAAKLRKTYGWIVYIKEV